MNEIGSRLAEAKSSKTAILVGEPREGHAGITITQGERTMNLVCHGNGSLVTDSDTPYSNNFAGVACDFYDLFRWEARND